MDLQILAIFSEKIDETMLKSAKIYLKNYYFEDF